MTSVPPSRILSEDDQEFMIDLYQKNYYQMTSICNRYISNPDERQDVIQAAMLSLIKKTDMLRTLDPCALIAYVHVTVRNTAVNFLRKKAMDKKLMERLDQLQSMDISDTDDMFLNLWYQMQFQLLWSQLPEKDAFLLAGRYIWGYSDSELAEQFHCKASSIRMMITRARRKAADLLNRQEYDD